MRRSVCSSCAASSTPAACPSGPQPHRFVHRLLLHLLLPLLAHRPARSLSPSLAFPLVSLSHPSFHVRPFRPSVARVAYPSRVERSRWGADRSCSAHRVSGFSLRLSPRPCRLPACAVVPRSLTWWVSRSTPSLALPPPLLAPARAPTLTQTKRPKTIIDHADSMTTTPPATRRIASRAAVNVRVAVGGFVLCLL